MRVYICGQKAFGKAVILMCIEEGHEIVGVSAPLSSSTFPDRPDRLMAQADANRIPVLPAGCLNKDTLPAGVDVIIAAHSHDFISRQTRLRCRIGAIGYHPSLLPIHRGRDAVLWALKMGDRVTGGSVYWLSDTVDGGDIAAQDWCFIERGETPQDLWREKLFPMGVALFRHVLSDLENGRLVAVHQDEAVATWEPSWSRPPIRRPDLVMIGPGLDDVEVVRSRSALHLHP